MSDKKHIDRLFQEKFKDFEAKPNANVWENIQNQLDQPKQQTKGVIPIWLRFASVAAALLLLFGIGSTLIKSDSNTIDNNSTIVNTDTDSTLNTTKGSNKATTSSNKDIKDESNSILENNDVTSNTPENVSSKTFDAESKNENNSNNKATYNRESSATNNVVANTTSENNSSQKVNDLTEKTTSEKQNTTMANVSSNKDAIKNNTLNNSSLSNNEIEGAAEKNNVNPVASNSASVNNKASNNGLETKNDALQNQNTVTDNNIVTNPQNDDIKINNAQNALNNTIQNTNADALVNTLIEKEKESTTVAKDSTNTNAIDEAIAKTEDIIEEEKPVNRWTINANVAPVYYNTLGKGSHIHDQFIDNPKNGEVNTSYGINVGYALNDRLKLRSGISKLNLSYDTANVIVYENVSNTPGDFPMRNIDFIPNSQGETISVLSASNLGIQQISSIANDELNAALSQRIGYIEIPLEVEYALVNKRFGVNVIGGMSTFILNDNEVVTEVDNRKTLIGKANNINNVSFSTNFGIGIDYKFTDTFKFNLEPTFKYQINAFSETSGDFKPYVIGVYTGFSYKF